MKIQRTRMDTLATGELICNVDDDSIETDTELNEAYDAKDQQWDVVCGLRGSEIELLRGDDSESRWVFVPSWDQWTWRQVTDDGTPVRVVGA